MATYDGRFAGRTALITGGASGLGRDVARRITQEGGIAILWDADPIGLARAANEVGTAYAQVVDVKSYDAVAHAAGIAMEATGQLDILINSAGITGPTVSVADYPVERWEEVLDINLTGTFFCCRALSPLMTKRGYGRIVNIASVAGKEGNPNASAYSAAKAGVLALTKSLGKELATSGVLANAVTPAVFESPLLAQMPETQVEFMRSKIPMGRLGRVEETTAMVCFLASEECSFSTAATFDVSGGRTTY